jgi:IS1 family transposase
MTIVDRSTSCILGWAVASERTETILQAMLDSAPQAAYYFSDLFVSYRHLIYAPGRYTPMPDKSETYRVEGDNAELRHYLARLARRSRCFSRCIKALRVAIKLFVYAWNRRQLYKARHPNYPAHVMEFI